MNLRLFSMALLMSALPALASADPLIKLNEGDFIAAKKITRDGKSVVSVKLSKSGKAKFKKLNKLEVNEEVGADIGGVTSSFRLREPIQGDGLEMGPYSAEDAQKVVSTINKGG